MRGYYALFLDNFPVIANEMSIIKIPAVKINQISSL